MFLCIVGFEARIFVFVCLVFCFFIVSLGWPFFCCACLPASPPHTEMWVLEGAAQATAGVPGFSQWVGVRTEVRTLFSVI